VLNKRYEMSAGKARLAKDMVNMDQVQEKESERKALEQGARRRKARDGNR
jgi:hypothetical protein